MVGKHAPHPWRDLGVLRSVVVVVGLTLFGIIRFFRRAPEWAVGLVLMVLIVIWFLVWAS